MKQIDLYIIVGFLGSGKTTFLKNMLNDFKNKKIAVVMNDFGKFNVDAKLIKERISDLEEISDGSLFCACKSDHFVATITELSKKELDVIIVEASGMANPNTMLNVLDLISKKSHQLIHFKGTIGLIDVNRIDKLIQVANMIGQQIACSDLLLLNKIDLVNEHKLLIINDLIKHYNLQAPIYFVKDAFIQQGIIADLEVIKDKILPANQVDLNTQKLMLALDEVIDFEAFDLFLITLEKEVQRLKGFVYKDNQCYFVQCISGKVSYVIHDDNNQEPYLVILSIMKKNLELSVEMIWSQYFTYPITIL